MSVAGPLHRRSEPAYDADNLAKLREIAAKDSQAATALWSAIEESERAAKKALDKARKPQPTLKERFVILIECENAAQQVAMLRRFKKEGLSCTAKID